MPTTLASSAPTQAQSSPTSVEFNVQLQAVDLFRAERTIALRQLRTFLGVAAAFVVFRAIMAESIFLLAAIAVISLFCFAIHSAFLYLGARSTIKTSKVLSGTTHYCLTQNELLLSTPTSWSRQAWGNVHELLETRSLLILRLSSAQKNVIPKRCLRAGDVERIRNLVRQGKARNSGLQDGTAITDSPLLAVRVKLRAEDLYWGFVTLLMRKSFWYAGQLAFSFVLIFALNPRFLSPMAFVAVGGLFVLYLAVFLYYSSSKAVRTNAAYQGEIQYAFCESGLEAAGPTFSFHHDWGNFQSVMETSKIFLFCPSSSQMLVIPRGCFANESQIQIVRQILRTHYHGKLSLKN